jgi:hypothetical protein
MDKDMKISAAVAGLYDALKTIEVASELSGQTTSRVLQVLTRAELEGIMSDCIIAVRHHSQRLKEAFKEEE